jgi:hypothetical protein
MITQHQEPRRSGQLGSGPQPGSGTHTMTDVQMQLERTLSTLDISWRGQRLCCLIQVLALWWNCVIPRPPPT